MSLKTALLPVVDLLRGNIPGTLGLRPHSVLVRVRTWTGARVGLGTKADADTAITNGTGFNPKVSQLSTKDVVASGGLYAAGDYRIGPITPAYAGGGTNPDVLNPPIQKNLEGVPVPTEVLYRISGPGFPTGGAWFKRVSDDGISNFHNSVVVRAMAVTP